MQTYARIQDGVVAELLTSAVAPAKLFHPALRWVAVTAPGVAVGWRETPAGLAAPAPEPPAPAEPAAPSMAELHARINALAAQVAALLP